MTFASTTLSIFSSGSRNRVAVRWGKPKPRRLR